MSLVLNKKLNELARASVSKLTTHLEMFGVYEKPPHNTFGFTFEDNWIFYAHSLIMCNVSDGNLDLQGSLGSLSLSDLTPHGDLYRERFTTRGGEALIFNIHKYRLQKLLKRIILHDTKELGRICVS